MDAPPNFKILTVYTTIRVIQEMCRKNGLEAALSYSAAYCRQVERMEPGIKAAIDATLAKTDVKFIHDEVVKKGGEL